MSVTHRFFQFAYPITVFFAVLLAWNSAAQVNGLADFRLPDFNLYHANRSPAQVQAVCSVKNPDALDAPSCTDDPSVPGKLLDTQDRSRGSDIPTPIRQYRFQDEGPRTPRLNLES